MTQSIALVAKWWWNVGKSFNSFISENCPTFDYFLSSYLLLIEHQLIFLAAGARAWVTLYPHVLSESESVDQIGLIRDIVLNIFSALCKKMNDITLKSTTSISGWILLGLCCTPIFSFGFTLWTHTLYRCMSRVLKRMHSSYPWIFVIQRIHDVPKYTLSIMKSMSSTQKKNVAVDASNLSEEYSPFMQQET